MSMDEEMISELLNNVRSRGDYLEALREFGVDVDIPPSKPLTRWQRIKRNYSEYKVRMIYAYQVITRGYHDRESDDW